VGLHRGGHHRDARPVRCVRFSPAVCRETDAESASDRTPKRSDHDQRRASEASEAAAEGEEARGQNPPVQVFLETERLVLRQFTNDDIDNLVELDSDPR